MLQCKIIKEGRNDKIEALINDIIEYQMLMHRPKNFDSQDPENVIKMIETSFENVCTTLEELGVNRPHELPTFSFYSKIAYFEKKNAKTQP